MSTTVSYKGSTIATVSNETKTLTTSGTWLEDDITLVDSSASAPTLQAKTNIDPTTSSQTIEPDTGYDGLSSVQINAIPTNYRDSIIFTAIFNENTGDLSSITCNKTYNDCYSIMNNNEDYSAIYVEIEGEYHSVSGLSGTIVGSSSYSNILRYNFGHNAFVDYNPNGTITITVIDASATTPDTSITANPTISVNTTTGLITATASASQSITPTVVGGYIISGTAGTVSVSGSNTSQLSTQAGSTITPTESEQTAVAANKYTLGDVKVGAISPTYVGSGIDQNDSDDLTISGATVIAPAGYYASSASKTVASGTAGTPTASKGTVSNHQVSVTPSVTNTTGYITGSTKTGTAVTVTASELASGNKAINSNGNNIDVVGYSTVSVAVPFSTITVSSSNPTGGSNGDVWIKTA